MQLVVIELFLEEHSYLSINYNHFIVYPMALLQYGLPQVISVCLRAEKVGLIDD